MKKTFTLTLLLTAVLASFAQSNSLQSNTVRSSSELDYTAWDWQTAGASINRTVVMPDGKVIFAYTFASDDTFADRGTSIGIYDSNTDQWSSLGERIEGIRSGYGSIARLGEHSIVVASHTFNDCRLWFFDTDLLSTFSTPLVLDYTNDPLYPVVMTSGPNREIIHVIASGYSDKKLYYFRSSDGGHSWDKENVILPYLTTAYGSDWGDNVAYWMETTDDNCLALVVNNSWSDGMVLYSYDDGETWQRKVFYQHPGINSYYDCSPDFGFLYPRWVSAQWGADNELCIAYEFNGTCNSDGYYYPGIGGVAFWSETMPYHGTTTPISDPNNPLPPTPGHPFIMDTAYLHHDIYRSWWCFGEEASHEMWPEYIGYLPALTDEGQPEPDPYHVYQFNINGNNLTNHGNYGTHGPVAMPTLCRIPGTNGFVAVWIAMDENHIDPTSGDFYYKLFASYSADGGNTWEPQILLTNDFYSEYVYVQAAVINQTLVMACQVDAETGSWAYGHDPDWGDNHYEGFTFELGDLFPITGIQETDSCDTRMAIAPNPATDQVHVKLSHNDMIKVFNVFGQNVMTLDGHVGTNVIEVGDLDSGIYFISAGSNTLKLIVR